MKTIRMVGVALVAASVIAGGCSRSSEPASGTPGVGERSGAAVDKAADKTVDAAKAVAEKTREVTGKALEKTGEVMEKAGESMDATGENMQDK
jgi:hypothetical protein